MKCEEEESFSEGRAILRHLLECGRNEPDLDLLFSFLKFKVLRDAAVILLDFGTIDEIFELKTFFFINLWSMTTRQQLNSPSAALRIWTIFAVLCGVSSWEELLLKFHFKKISSKSLHALQAKSCRTQIFKTLLNFISRQLKLKTKPIHAVFHFVHKSSVHTNIKINPMNGWFDINCSCRFAWVLLSVLDEMGGNIGWEQNQPIEITRLFDL